MIEKMEKDIEEILKKLVNKEISIKDAQAQIKANLIKDVGNLAKLDIFRRTRTGVPEVIYAENKSPRMVLEIVRSFLESKQFAIVSRYTELQKESILNEFKDSSEYDIDINELGKTIVIKEISYEFPKKAGKVGIITAGSSDIPIAEEAKIIAFAMGCKISTSYDVGIAGLHRIFEPLSEMIKEHVHVIIVCAGMEGTLPGVVSALVDVPVIGVPVSSGYGLGKEGKGALTTMLQSCSPGLLVVNIDNGFGAGASAALIANKMAH
jgi:NCAIR mutase (PurE)-related protein